MSGNKSILLRISAALKDALTVLAKKDKRSLTSYLQVLLEEHVREKANEGIVKAKTKDKKMETIQDVLRRLEAKTSTTGERLSNPVYSIVEQPNGWEIYDQPGFYIWAVPDTDD